MKVIRTRLGVLVGGCGLIASSLGLTVIIISSAAAPTVSIASGSMAKACPGATVIEASGCVPR